MWTFIIYTMLTTGSWSQSTVSAPTLAACEAAQRSSVTETQEALANPPQPFTGRIWTACQEQRK